MCASPRPHLAALHAPRFREARWLPASGVRGNSSQRLTCETPQRRRPLRQFTRHAPRHVQTNTARCWPRGAARAKSTQKLVGSWTACAVPRKTIAARPLRSAASAARPAPSSGTQKKGPMPPSWHRPQKPIRSRLLKTGVALAGVYSHRAPVSTRNGGTRMVVPWEFCEAVKPRQVQKCVGDSWLAAMAFGRYPPQGFPRLR